MVATLSVEIEPDLIRQGKKEEHYRQREEQGEGNGDVKSSIYSLIWQYL